MTPFTLRQNTQNFLMIVTFTVLVSDWSRAQENLRSEIRTDVQAIKDAENLPIAFDRYTTVDTLGRAITFYLSKPSKDAVDQKLPLVLFVEGSGCQSLFSKVGDRIGAGLHGLVYAEGRAQVRVVAVEKPGVKFLDSPTRPGTAEGASEEFLKEHTLERWSEANIAAVQACWTVGGIDSSRTMVMGHSEGGIIAARVAAELPQINHVAGLSCGGPTQLFDFLEFASQPQEGDTPEAAAWRRDAVLESWQQILNDPESTSKFWMAHPYRRWSTFLRSSVIQELSRSKARIFMAQGTEDKATSVRGFDVAVPELKAHGRDLTAIRLEGADHSFQPKDAVPGSPDGLRKVFRHCLEWFLMEPKAGK